MKNKQNIHKKISKTKKVEVSEWNGTQYVIDHLAEDENKPMPWPISVTFQILGGKKIL